jgi:hypothetical protein
MLVSIDHAAERPILQFALRSRPDANPFVSFIEMVGNRMAADLDI